MSNVHGPIEPESDGASPGTSISAPFVRSRELEDIRNAIANGDCPAVIIRFDTGLGASTILRHLVQAESPVRPVLTIHGTPSLGSFPYGVLAPILRTVKSDGVGIRTNVLRAFLATLAENAMGDSKKAGKSLIVVDDAHAVDPSTAELLVTLVLSGTVQLVASHLRNKTLPDPLPRLWQTGNAETIELFPLTQKQGHSLCQTMLDAPFALQTSWYFWTLAGGNPMLMRMLVAEALEDGLLYRRGGVWLYRDGRHQAGHSLHDAVRQQIRGLSAAARDALDIVALAEPVSLSMVEQVSGKAAVKELAARQLVQRQFLEEEVLRLANPIYGDVIRQLVPPAHSRILHDNLLERLEAEPPGTEALLRRVSWELDVGLNVATERILSAALIACKLSQPNSALELIAYISAPDTTLRARAIQARAHYMVGDYERAAELLDGGFEQGASLTDLLFGALLRATTRVALGMPTTAMEDDINKLVLAGERLAESVPGQAAAILEQIAQKTKLMRLMVLSRNGEYGSMAPLIESVLADESNVSEEERKLNASFALAMEAERLCALGQATKSQQRSAEAFAIKHTEDYDVFFIPETIVFRQLTTALCTGDLPFVAELLDQFFVDAGPVILTFGGGANVARGMGLMRQGLLEEAVDVLLPTIESLRVNDPQQLLGFCISMTAYAAAKVGRQTLARRLISEHREKPAMFIVTAHERAFMAGAREYDKRDGTGLADLVSLANDFRSQQAPLLELNALAIAVELGEHSQLGRLMQLAPRVEGRWAEAIAHFGQQLEQRIKGNTTKQAALQPYGEAPQVNQVPWFTAPVFSSVSVEVDAKLALPGESIPKPAHTNAAHKDPELQLTPREREIATLAVQGLSDRLIAEKLSLSTRTVEGHLYRCYAKLGIAGREDLPASLNL